MYQYRNIIFLILSALFQQLTLGSNPHPTKSQVNAKVTAPTLKYEILHGNKISLTNTDDTDPSQGSVTSPTIVDNPENYQSSKMMPAMIKVLEKDQFERNESSSTKTDRPDFNISYGSLNSPTKIKTENDLSHKTTPLPSTIKNPEKDQLQGSVTSPTKPDNPEIYQSHRSNASSRIDNPEIDLSHASGPLSNRRQNPGQLKPFNPPSDIEIARLLNEYRGFANKYDPQNPGESLKEANYGSQDQHNLPRDGDNIERFNVGKRGPIRKIPHRTNSRSSGMVRQGQQQQHGFDEETTIDEFEPQTTIAAVANIQQETTQNEAMGAASRFTTRTTTTRRRRRTPPSRVSFTENCDYLAYYCLKAYETGRVCARYGFYLWQHTRTFENYCIVDFVNCIMRYQVWVIEHMGACVGIQVLTEYKEYEYADESFLDGYYVMEDS